MHHLDWLLTCLRNVIEQWLDKYIHTDEYTGNKYTLMFVCLLIFVLFCCFFFFKVQFNYNIYILIITRNDRNFKWNSNKEFDTWTLLPTKRFFWTLMISIKMNFRIKTHSTTTIQPPQGSPPLKVLLKLAVTIFTNATTFKHFIPTKTKNKWWFLFAFKHL